MAQILRFGPFLRDISYLDKKLSVESLRTRLTDLRKRYKVAVIDDKPFTPSNYLQRNEYDITYFRDIDRIEQVQGYPLILCDLSGVGVSLNPQMQGAHIIGEIKRSYPEKYVIAYTGEGYSEIYERSIYVADDLLKKDITPGEWVEALDTAIEALSNPSIVWKSARVRLLRAGVTPYQLAVLEDVYVSKVIGGAPDLQAAMFERVDRLRLSGDVRAVIQSAIGSLLIEAVKAWLFSGGH